jgi:hypothetical protein
MMIRDEQRGQRDLVHPLGGINSHEARAMPVDPRS